MAEFNNSKTLVVFHNKKTMVGINNTKTMVGIYNKKTLVGIYNKKAMVEIFNTQTLVGFNTKDPINDKDSLVVSNQQKAMVKFGFLELELMDAQWQRKRTC